jgi:hypothetical protein
MPLNADKNRWGSTHTTEAFHRAFTLSGGLVGVLGPVVQAFVAAVLDGGHDLAAGNNLRSAACP